MIIFMSPLPKVKSRRVVANMSIDLTGGKLHRPPFRPWHRNFKRFAVLPPFFPVLCLCCSKRLHRTIAWQVALTRCFASQARHWLRATASPASPAARKMLGVLIADSLAAARAKSIQDIHQHGGQKWSQGNMFQKMMPSSSRGHNPSNVTSLFRGGYTECEPTQKSRQIDVAWPPKNMTEFLCTEFCWTNS